MNKVVIFRTTRTLIGSIRDGLSSVHPDDLAAVVIHNLTRARIDPNEYILNFEIPFFLHANWVKIEARGENMKKFGMAILLLVSCVALAQTQKKVIAAGFACQTKSAFKALVAVKDAKAQAKQLAISVKSGQCINLKKGDSVEQTGTSFVDDLVKIRYVNKLTAYWTAATFLN